MATPRENASREKEMVALVKEMTKAITVISESTRQNAETSGAIKEMISVNRTANDAAFATVSGKVDGLMTMFKYVIMPLIGGILALVGVKLVLNQ